MLGDTEHFSIVDMVTAKLGHGSAIVEAEHGASETLATAQNRAKDVSQE